MKELFLNYEQSLALKELGFDEPCFAYYVYPIWVEWKEFRNQLQYPYRISRKSPLIRHQNDYPAQSCSTPTFSQAVNFLYICSNKQIDIELKASDTYEERIRKITKGCEDLRNLQNNKSN